MKNENDPIAPTKIFSGGRLCLFGEHSDWAGSYRRLNPAVGKGYTILTGTDRGLYATVKSHPTHLIVKSRLEDGSQADPLSLPMDATILESVARRGGFYSYVAGVARQMLTRYAVGGVEIDNYKTDLPVKKGLSSSAAVCVLAVRAFDRAYNLDLSIAEQMELAYRGERLTPSACGRMDQACAYGTRPILMTFDGDRTEIEELTLGGDLYLFVVDLAGQKDTRAILDRLNSCYPHAQNPVQRGVQNYLGEINARLIGKAIAAMKRGAADRLGYLMTLAQKEFDRYLIPACAEQLRSPRLHHLLAYEPLRPYIFGGKGVGSQGDGTAQFVARDALARQRAIARIEADFPGMRGFPLTLKADCGGRS